MSEKWAVIGLKRQLEEERRKVQVLLRDAKENTKTLKAAAEALAAVQGKAFNDASIRAFCDQLCLFDFDRYESFVVNAWAEEKVDLMVELFKEHLAEEKEEAPA